MKHQLHLIELILFLIPLNLFAAAGDTDTTLTPAGFSELNRSI